MPTNAPIGTWPAAATKTKAHKLRAQLAENGATDVEIEILLSERVELNALTSDALVEMIERKLQDYGLEKVIPEDELLAKAYRGFHRSQQLRAQFEEMRSRFEENAADIEIPGDLQERVGAILNEHRDLRWDDAVRIMLDATQLDRVRADKQKARKASGDFTEPDEDDEDDESAGGDD
jgi:hypothetical protein